MGNATRKKWMSRLRRLKRGQGYKQAAVNSTGDVKVTVPGTKTG